MAENYGENLSNYQKYKDKRTQFFIKRDIDKLAEEGGSFGNPSIIKYSFLFLIAGIVDIIDFLDFTGFGYIIALTSSIIGTSVIAFTLWITDTKQNQAREYLENAEKNLVEIQRRISQASQIALKSSKFLRKFKTTRKLGNAAIRAMAKIRKTARKSPLGKIVIGSAINAVPIIGAINLMVVYVYFTYRSEKKTYEEAKEAGEEIAEALAEEVSLLEEYDVAA